MTDRWIDIFKGLGILCIVAGHCGAPLAKYYSLWHVAIFFIVSGYTYKTNYSDSIRKMKEKWRRLIKRLYIPFVIVGVTYTCLNNVFCD